MKEIVWTIVRKSNRYLLVQRDLEDVAGGLWSFPGGKMNEEDSSKQHAAMRELEEETSIIAEDMKELFKTILNQYKIVFFLCDHWAGEARCGSGVIGTGWFTIPEIYNLDKSLDPFLSKALPQLAFSVRHDFFGEG